MNHMILQQALERIRDINTSETATGLYRQNRTAEIAQHALDGAFKDPGPKQ